MDYSLIDELISKENYYNAEKLLKASYINSAKWHFLYSKIMLSKLWFDSAFEHLQIATTLDQNNIEYKEELITLIRRNRHYSDDYYRSDYRRRRSGCSCCCCDDCCCDCDISCCDLICLDSCCECMGGDLIECI